MQGLDQITGKSVQGIAHLRQSVTDILTTPIGSRVMRRGYGSRLFSLIDAPYSDPIKLDIIAATAEALMTWEPRMEVETVVLSSYTPGHIEIDLTALYLPEGDIIELEGIVVQ